MNKQSNFNERCYELLKQVPKGKVTTYAEIAKALDTKAWRVVGSAMANNKNLIVVPCHRVVKSDGSIGQYALGADKKASLLLSEGVDVQNGKVKSFAQFLYRFNP